MPKITLQQMVRQWAGASHKFEVNLSNAEAQLAMFATETFRKSFQLQKFNSKGAPKWRPLKSKAKPTQNRVIRLIETGALMDSIQHTFRHVPGGASKITVFTDEKYFARENRNKSGQCFAAIHNSGGSIEATSGSNASSILQRQFMPTEKGEQSSGDSSYMIDYYNKLHIKIFYGLPQ